MKKYLISIESQDSKRLQGFYAQPTFYKYKEDFKQFGIIGKNLSVSQYFEMGVAGKNKAMTPGELGCTLSHLEALKDFLSTDEKYAIIFEDDVIERFKIDFDDLENQIENLGLGDNFLFSLGGIQMKICRKVRGQVIRQNLLGQNVLKVDPYFYENLAYAYAYVVDRKMAQTLLNFHEVPKVYDHWYEMYLQLNEIMSLYVCYLFDHPKIENVREKSYLESERQKINDSQTSYNRGNPNYFIKIVKKISLTKYEF